jgi:hypothetical protein
MPSQVIVMSRRLMIAIATGSTFGVWFYPSAAVADSVPSWDVTASCRGAAQAGYICKSLVRPWNAVSRLNNAHASN